MPLVYTASEATSLHFVITDVVHVQFFVGRPSNLETGQRLFVSNRLAPASRLYHNPAKQFGCLRSGRIDIELRGCRAFGSEPKGWAFPRSAFAETLEFCAVFVGSLLENPKTGTTFLPRSASGEIGGTGNRL
jgi:hypothetical protein